MNIALECSTTRAGSSLLEALRCISCARVLAKKRLAAPSLQLASALHESPHEYQRYPSEPELRHLELHATSFPTSVPLTPADQRDAEVVEHTLWKHQQQAALPRQKTTLPISSSATTAVCCRPCLQCDQGYRPKTRRLTLLSSLWAHFQADQGGLPPNCLRMAGSKLPIGCQH